MEINNWKISKCKVLSILKMMDRIIFVLDLLIRWREIACALVSIFNKSIKLEVVPGDWRIANIVALFMKVENKWFHQLHAH